jgi:hypothetical protein
MSTSLNIFVLHALGKGMSRARKTSIDHACCWKRYAPHHNYYYHDINAPVSDRLRNSCFHIVIFDTTALCIRYYRPKELFLREKKRYSFIAEWDAVKVAFPQDDYDHSAILDRWLDDYRFDLVYSVVWDHRMLLYPRTIRRAQILPALTGYVDDNDIHRTGSFASRFEQRPIDMGYRAKFLPAQFGSYGQIKGLLAGRMQRAVAGYGYKTDIATDPDNVLLGDEWLRFLGNCKLCLGSEGGSSVWDPEGEITDRVNAYAKQNPNADFPQIAQNCFPGEDRKYVFSAISPRLFEAALARCGQILVNGPYLNVLEPGTHFVAIDEECQNIEDVLRAFRDVTATKKMIDECFDALIASRRFRYSRHVADVLELAERLAVERRIQGSPPAEIARLEYESKKLLDEPLMTWMENIRHVAPKPLKSVVRSLRFWGR